MRVTNGKAAGEVISTIAVQHVVLFVVKLIDGKFDCWSIQHCQEMTEQEYKEWHQPNKAKTGTR
mgnify:CR=1 FL=1